MLIYLDQGRRISRVSCFSGFSTPHAQTCTNYYRWTLSKKKPLDTIVRAHGLEDPLLPSVASSEEHPSSKVVPPPQPRGITSLRALPYSDLILSGSTDGFIGKNKISYA